MKRTTTLIKLLLPAVLLMAGIAAKAQVAALADLTPAVAAYCPADQVKLTASATGAASYTWVRYAGKTATGTATPITGTSANLVDAPADPGYYTYVSTALNTDNCNSAPSDPVVVYMLPGITASVTAPNAQFCVNPGPAGLTLTAVPAKSGAAVTETFAYTYQWLKGGTPISGATGATYALNNTTDATVGANNYTVKVGYQVKPACAATESAAYTITVVANAGKPTVTITP